MPLVLPLILPLAILALPFLDLTMAFVRRTYAGRWWFLPDKQHLHHRLLERGHSQRRAVLLMYVWSALVSFGVACLGLVPADWQWRVVGGGAAVRDPPAAGHPGSAGPQRVPNPRGLSRRQRWLWTAGPSDDQRERLLTADQFDFWLGGSLVIVFTNTFRPTPAVRLACFAVPEDEGRHSR